RRVDTSLLEARGARQTRGPSAHDHGRQPGASRRVHAHATVPRFGRPTPELERTEDSGVRGFDEPFAAKVAGFTNATPRPSPAAPSGGPSRQMQKWLTASHLPPDPGHIPSRPHDWWHVKTLPQLSTI